MAEKVRTLSPQRRCRAILVPLLVLVEGAGPATSSRSTTCSDAPSSSRLLFFVASASRRAVSISCHSSSLMSSSSGINAGNVLRTFCSRAGFSSETRVSSSPVIRFVVVPPPDLTTSESFLTVRTCVSHVMAGSAVREKSDGHPRSVRSTF